MKVNRENVMSAQRGWSDAPRLAQAFRADVAEGRALRGISRLFSQLDFVRRTTRAEEWAPFAAEVRERLRDITEGDPLTARSLQKPRGYAGDAPTLDIIYRHAQAPVDLASLRGVSRAMASAVNDRPATVSVRLRRELLGRAIDQCATRHPQARILSFACGHLRELECVSALGADFEGKLFAVDQDLRSLEVVRQTTPACVETVQMHLKELLAGASPAGELDLAYSAGLFDYLDETTATRTTTALFRLLRPGGRLLLANFHPSLVDIGYMEACMDWWLIYRDEGAMLRLLAELDPTSISSTDVWCDATGAIVYLDVRKAS